MPVPPFWKFAPTFTLASPLPVKASFYALASPNAANANANNTFFLILFLNFTPQIYTILFLSDFKEFSAVSNRVEIAVCCTENIPEPFVFIS